MRTIRLGNDIRLTVTISGISDFDMTSIKQIKCMLTRVVSEDDDCSGYPKYYISDEYNMNHCGIPSYNAHPCNEMFDPFRMHHEYYRGFGINLKSNHKCNKNNRCDFLMPSRILKEENNIECYFPATEQRDCGTYKLAIVLVVYQYGWGLNNLRTYTIDYGEVFLLVNNNTGESGDISITIDNNSSSYTKKYYAGFLKYASNVLLNLSDLQEYDVPEKNEKVTIDITNTAGDGAYFWIASENDISYVSNGGIQVPMKTISTKLDFVWSRTSNALANNTKWNFEITFND